MRSNMVLHRGKEGIMQQTNKKLTQFRLDLDETGNNTEAKWNNNLNKNTHTHIYKKNK